MAKKPKFNAVVMIHGVNHYGGSWSTRLLADIAKDRLRLYFNARGRLRYPEEARALGPASPRDLLLESRRTNKIESGRSSYFLGVTFDKKRGLYEALVNVGNKQYAVVGYFDDAEEAGALRDRVVLHIDGPGALLNFPERRPLPLSLEEARKITNHQARTKTAASSTELRGIVRTRSGTFLAVITHNRERHTVGTFDSLKLAGLAFDRAALFLRGPKAKLNFPSERLIPASPAETRREGRAIWKAGTTSRHTGVSWDGNQHCWSAYIDYSATKRDFIGSFDDEDEAGLARDAAMLHHFGPSVRDRLNFPDRPTKPRSVAEIRAELWARFKERTSSDYTGVTWSHIEQKWRAIITVDGTTHKLGAYENEIDAARAYDRAARKFMGPTAFQNFPTGKAARPTPRTRRRSKPEG